MQKVLAELGDAWWGRGRFFRKYTVGFCETTSLYDRDVLCDIDGDYWIVASSTEKTEDYITSESYEVCLEFSSYSPVNFKVKGAAIERTNDVSEDELRRVLKELAADGGPYWKRYPRK